MTKGIRAFVIETFNNTLPKLAEMGNIAFRREVMSQAIMSFDISIASAATHYNHALKAAKESNPEAVNGLGRAEDKKGGRKHKVVAEPTVDVIKVKTGEIIVAGVSKAVAEEMIAKAVAAKKAKLAIKEVAAAIITDAVAAVEAEHVEGVNVEFIAADPVAA